MSEAVRMVLRITIALSLILPGTAFFQPARGQARLHVGLIRTQGYTATGSALSSSGLYRHEGDSTWTHIGWNHPRVNGIAADPRDPTVLYIAAGNGVLRTQDGGRTWRIMTGWEVTESQDVTVDPSTPEHVYVATPFGIWRSVDQGETWEEANDGFGPMRYTHAVEVDRTQVGRLFAATWEGLYRSDDGAASWSLLAPVDLPVLALRQSPADPAVWLAGTQERGVLLSSDRGNTWRPAAGAIADETIYTVDIDPSDGSRMAAAGWGTGVFVSTDGGTTWEQRGQALPVPNVYEVIFDVNDPGRLWAATVEAGIFYSDDTGRTWRPAGMDGTLVFDMTFIGEAAKP